MFSAFFKKIFNKWINFYFFLQPSINDVELCGSFPKDKTYYSFFSSPSLSPPFLSSFFSTGASLLVSILAYSVGAGRFWAGFFQGTSFKSSEEYNYRKNTYILSLHKLFFSIMFEHSGYKTIHTMCNRTSCVPSAGVTILLWW